MEGFEGFDGFDGFKGFDRFAGGQTAVSNAVKKHMAGAWLRHVGLWRGLRGLTGLRATKRQQSRTP